MERLPFNTSPHQGPGGCSATCGCGRRTGALLSVSRVRPAKLLVRPSRGNLIRSYAFVALHARSPHAASSSVRLIVKVIFARALATSATIAPSGMT